ncbi:MAG: hypothetical protein EAZ89_21730, partial [Bacteroidetes bacterium]
MENAEILALWKTYGSQLEKNISQTRQNAKDISRMKVTSSLASMTPLKVFALAVGIVWVLFVDTLIINLFHIASPFFLVSAILQVVLTKIAIGLYLYQLVLIRQVDISEPVLKTQETIARLQSSTLQVTRILFLQLPLWTTFHLNETMFRAENLPLLIINGLLTLLFSYAAFWLFINIRYENREQRWF